MDRFGESRCQNIKISHGIETPHPTQTACIIYCWHSLPHNSFACLPLHQVLSDQRLALENTVIQNGLEQAHGWTLGDAHKAVLGLILVGHFPLSMLWFDTCVQCGHLVGDSCSPNLQTLLLVSCTPLEFTETNSQVLVSVFSSFLLYPFCGSWKHLVFLCTLSP